MSPRPFTIQTSDEALADLRQRLERTRWPDAETPDDWSQGVPL
ncbi:MAG: epoxide hydrolase N-terminal domain-containing protein, partial [Pseudomonadales bacterium]